MASKTDFLLGHGEGYEHHVALKLSDMADIAGSSHNGMDRLPFRLTYVAGDALGVL